MHLPAPAPLRQQPSLHRPVKASRLTWARWWVRTQLCVWTCCQPPRLHPGGGAGPALTTAEALRAAKEDAFMGPHAPRGDTVRPSDMCSTWAHTAGAMPPRSLMASTCSYSRTGRGPYGRGHLP